MHDSLGVTEIGVIPPPPMFSSPSPPIRHILPPPKEHSQHQVPRELSSLHIYWSDHQGLIFPPTQATGVTTARGHDLSDHQFAKGGFHLNHF